MKNLPSIEALESVHDFPGRYLVKVFGPERLSFATDIDEACRRVLGDEADVKWSTRYGSKGTLVCISLDAHVASAQQVQALYRELCPVEGLKMLL